MACTGFAENDDAIHRRGKLLLSPVEESGGRIGAQNSVTLMSRIALHAFKGVIVAGIQSEHTKAAWAPNSVQNDVEFSFGAGTLNSRRRAGA